MDVRLPNGHVIQNVPDGTSKEAIMEKAIRGGLATAEDFGEQPSAAPSPKGITSGFPEAMKAIEPMVNPPKETLESRYSQRRKDMGEEPSYWDKVLGFKPDVAGAGKGDYRTNPLYDGPTVTEVRSAIKDPSLTRGEIDKKQKDFYVDALGSAAKSSLMFTPTGAGLAGAMGTGALVGGGEAAVDVGKQYLKGEDVDLKEAAREIGLGAVIGGGVGSGLHGLGSLAGKLIPGKNIDVELAGQANKLGIKLPVGEVLDNNRIRAIETVMEEGLGGGAIRKAKEEVVGKAGKVAESTGKTLGKDYLLSKYADDVKLPGGDYVQSQAERTPYSKILEGVNADIAKAAKVVSSKSESPFIKGLANKAEFGEDVWGSLNKGDKVAKMKKFMREASKTGDVKNLQKGFRVKFYDDAYNNSMVDGVFSPKAFTQHLNDNKDFVKQFSANGSDDIHKGLVKFMSKMSNVEKSVKEPKSALTSIAMQLLPSTLGGVTGGFTGGWEGALAGAAGGLTARKLGSMGSVGLGNFIQKNAKTFKKLSTLTSGKEYDEAVNTLTKSLLTLEVIPE